MDEWVDDETGKAPGLKRDKGSYPISLIQDPLAEPPDGDRVCWALVKSTFWPGPGPARSLTNGKLKDWQVGMQLPFHLSLNPQRRGKENIFVPSHLPQAWACP